MSRLASASFVFAAFTCAAGTPRPQDLAANMPMRFEANAGQLPAGVRFASRGIRSSVFLTGSEAVLALDRQRLRISLPGSNRDPRLEGEQPLAVPTNYFTGNNPAAWRAGVHNFGRVRYSDVYNGIDLVYYGNGRQLEFDFVVRPGADPRRIRMSFRGADKVWIDSSGDLRIRIGQAELCQPKPVVYQEIRHGKSVERVPVEGRYALRGKSEAAFVVGRYNRGETLVIDPVLLYSSYFGGNNTDAAAAAAVDANGNVWIAGTTSSNVFDIRGDTYDADYSAAGDVFVAQFSPSRGGPESLLYSTFLGGANNEDVKAIRVDAQGRVYVAGSTASTDFPIAGNTAQTTNGGDRDAFVAIIDPRIGGSGGLAYSTYFGGTATEAATALDIDRAGNIYVAGYTSSKDMPTGGTPLQDANRGGYEAFIVRYSAAGARQYASYFGGTTTDVATGIAVDATGLVFLSGYTFSGDFPVTDNVYRSSYAGGGDIFVTRLDFNRPGLDALQYSTYIGGSGLDVAYGMALDPAGQVVLTGYSLSSDFPLIRPTQPNYGGNVDVIVCRLNTRLAGTAALTYSTYLGGSEGDIAYGLALDTSGRIYITGYTFSNNFPRAGAPAQPDFGGGIDAFLAILNPEASGGAALLYASYFGGGGIDVGYGVAVDSAGRSYLAGSVQSQAFPLTPNAYQFLQQGVTDSFVIQLSQ